MTTNGTSAVTERSACQRRRRCSAWTHRLGGLRQGHLHRHGRHDAFGAGRRAAAGQTGFMHVLVAFAKPFRMPDFFLISGLFLSVVIDRDWRTYLDRKVVHFAYFYLLWVTIQFGFKAPVFAAETGWLHVGFLYLESFIEPFGTLVVHLSAAGVLCGHQGDAQNAAAADLGRPGVTGDGAYRDRLDRDRRVLRALRLFLFRLSVRRSMCSRCPTARGHGRAGARGTGAVGARQWQPGCIRLQRMAAGLAAARARRRLRHRHDRHAAGAGALAQFPALLRRAFHRHLSRVLPADGGDANAAAAGRFDPRHRDDLADRHHRRRRRSAGDLADRAQGRRQFPVRAPRRVLDRAEESPQP